MQNITFLWKQPWAYYGINCKIHVNSLDKIQDFKVTFYAYKWPGKTMTQNIADIALTLPIKDTLLETFTFCYSEINWFCHCLDRLSGVGKEKMSLRCLIDIIYENLISWIYFPSSNSPLLVTQPISYSSSFLKEYIC